jgi:hypothetical protein
LDKPQQAKHLLSDEFFQEIISDYQTEQLDRFKYSGEFDYEQRESAYKKLLVVDEILARIQSVASQKEIEKKRWKIL